MWIHVFALGLATIGIDPEPNLGPSAPISADRVMESSGFADHGSIYGGAPIYGSANIPVGPAARNPGLLACYPYSCSCPRPFGMDSYGRPVSHPIIDSWLRSPCNMPLHQAYILLHPDNYYFRPYGLTHINEQREAVLAWGGDPRHPYANEIFQRVYDEWEADRAGREDIPAPDTSDASEPEQGTETQPNDADPLAPPLPPNLNLDAPAEPMLPPLDPLP